MIGTTISDHMPPDLTRDSESREGFVCEEQSTKSIAGTMRRRKRLRLADYDYSEVGAYFVTMCAKDREHLFGEISNGVMCLNMFGETVQECWNSLPKHYSLMELDAFVVMPNHVHGIIVIVDPVGSIHESTLPKTIVERRAMLLPKIVGRFKMNSAKRINERRGTPGVPVWQRNYFEHIIRNDKSLHRIREYIAANPQRWQYDNENVAVTGTDEFIVWLDSEGRKSLEKKEP
jgi:REP element-mobilizing transposase RayT